LLIQTRTLLALRERAYSKLCLIVLLSEHRRIPSGSELFNNSERISRAGDRFDANDCAPASK